MIILQSILYVLSRLPCPYLGSKPIHFILQKEDTQIKAKPNRAERPENLRSELRNPIANISRPVDNCFHFQQTTSNRSCLWFQLRSPLKSDLDLILNCRGAAGLGTIPVPLVESDPIRSRTHQIRTFASLHPYVNFLEESLKRYV